jgi:mono/diheme cytochrome c family protein
LSRRSALALLAACSLAGASGCWEQLDGGQWFPQMKQQPAVQAFEEVRYQGRVEPFTPPEGSVPIDGGEAPVSNVVDAESDVLSNPVAADLRSLENGRALYETNCAVCHGKTGLADGPVAPVFAGVLPLVGVVKARSDGHIYTTIRYGRRRMPGYGRIPAEDRWDIVNYVRYLDQKGGQP